MEIFKYYRVSLSLEAPKLLSMYTVEQRGFLVRKYWQTGSFKACQTAFRTEYGKIRALSDRLCGLVVRVSGYRYRGLGFDSRRYQIF